MKEIKEKVQKAVKANFCKVGSELLDKWIAAHNRYQENECDCADYLYNLNNTDDLIWCIKGGMTAEKLASLVNTTFWGEDKGSSFFRLGTQAQRLSVGQTKNIVYSYVDEIMEDVLKYPYIEEYRPIYELYVAVNF